MEFQKINTVLLSYGMSGEIFHGPLLAAHSGFHIYGIWQRDPSKAAKHRYRVVTDLEAILKDDSVELVVVNTPNHTHYEYAKRALQAGKHVLVEKPFTVTIREADELIALAKSVNKIITVFQNRRWDGDFLTIQKLVREKWLGKIVAFEAHYDRYRNYIEANTWKEVANPGTGILYNLGSHMIDQVLILFGKPNDVTATMGIQRPGGKVHDYYDIRLGYPSLEVTVKSSYLVREQGPRYTVHGTEGSFIKYGIDPQEQALKDKKAPGTVLWGSESKQWWGKLNTTLNTLHIEGVIETVPGNYLGFYDNLYEAIRLGKPLAVKPEEARQVIQVIEASVASSNLRQTVRL